MKVVTVTYRPETGRMPEVIAGATHVEADHNWVTLYAPGTGTVAVVPSDLVLKIAIDEVPDENKGDGD